ncbi:MAG: methyltransferase domain-containing protein [Deltaproteobacteria bacterium]|nr:methyltransferase domain-containing protein [Deltaproteobacteria bacterium]
MNGTFDKECVRRAFSMAAGTYDSYGNLQKEVARDVVSFLKKGPGITLDAGCGTGTLAQSVREVHPSSTIYGCDFSMPMLRTAAEKLAIKKGRHVGADCESLPFKDSSFDTVVSSLAYHWVTDLPAAFYEVFRVLKPGGLFLFSTAGPETFRELRVSIEEAKRMTGKNGLPALMGFAGKEEILKTLEKAGFGKIRADGRRREKYYGGLKELLRTLKHTGAINPMPGGDGALSRGSLLKEAAAIYKERFSSPDGRCPATYDVILVTAEKSL